LPNICIIGNGLGQFSFAFAQWGASRQTSDEHGQIMVPGMVSHTNLARSVAL